MASIFLSYARDDSARAGRVASALESAGHRVWWDRNIHAGARFSAEIAAELNAAELVVVLWSRSSVESPWVHDEAAAARDSGRLVPVLIEPVEPPLGFRQYQAVTLNGGLARARSVQPLIEALAERGAASAPPVRRKSVRRSPGWKVPALVAAALLVALAGAWFLMSRPSDRASHVIAVAAAQGGDQRRSQELARTIATDLGRYRAGPLGALTVLGGNDPKASGADYRVEVGVAPAGPGLRADVSLLSRGDRRILWSTSVEGPGGALVDLRQQAVAKLGDVLTCSVEVETYSRKISREVLGLYLNGCSLMSDLNVSEPDQTTLSIFRQITEKAPDFAPGWGNLALLEGQSFPGTPPPDRPALRKSVIAHLTRAKQLDPDYPATIAADANFHPDQATKPAHALALLDRGLERHPDSAMLHELRAFYLRRVGRSNEGVTATRRAVELNPLSPILRDSYLSALAYAGRTDAAFKELRDAEAMWPGSTVLRQARYRLDLRYGDPRNAMRLLRERGAGDLQPVPMDTSWEAFLEARMDPSPARVEKALEGFRDRYRSDHGHVVSYIQALGTFGRVEEAFEVVWTPGALDSLMAGTDLLFRPHMRAIRADPRFIALAAKLGLVAFWEKTGVWPDFCSEPQLPYDCRAQANKLTAEQRKIAPQIY